MDITRRISDYNWSSGNNIEWIVIHDTGNFKDTAAGNANFFNTGDRQASAHYFADEKEIYQIVEEFNASWHCGDRYSGVTSNHPECNNHNSIGIEMCNSGGYIASSTIDNTLELVKMLMAKYNIPADRVIRHYDVSGKICPNNMSANDWAKWKEFKSKLSGENKTTGYVVTNYLPAAYQGYDGVNISNIINTYFSDVTAYIRSNSKGVWIETQTLSIDKCNSLKNSLGDLFYSIE